MTPGQRFKKCTAALLGVAVLGGGSLARADLLSDWNSLAQGSIRAEQDLGPESSRNLAMLHTAMYNAIEGIAGTYYLYSTGSYSGPSAAALPGASMEAAAAAAAYTIMQSLYPNQGVDAAILYSTQISGMADDQARLDGIDFGTRVAQDILSWRSSDGASSAGNTALYNPTGGIGHWQPLTPDTEQLPGWSSVATFGITNTGAYTGSLPGTLESFVQSAQYATDYNYVKDYGSATSVLRSADQLNAAFFWAANQGSVTTAGMWNQVAETVAAAAGMDLQEKARLYAALNVAMADAAIVTWETKFDTDFWSPLLAIANGDADGNALTLGDDQWASLLNELRTPGYFSEQSALSAAAAQILAGMLGNDNLSFLIGIDTNNDGVADVYRSYDSFSEAAAEAGMSQIWGGVSFGTGNTDSANSGQAIGDYVLNNYFGPVPEPSGAVLMLLAGGTFLLVRRRR